MQIAYHATHLADTTALAEKLAAAIDGGLVIGLNGPLGAGKTTFVRALCAALGADERSVASPTFVLMHQYRGRMTINHFDAYRIGCLDEFLELGVDEYFESDALCIVEWASRVESALPLDRLTIEIAIAGPDARTFELRATGPGSARVIERLAEQLPVADQT